MRHPSVVPLAVHLENGQRVYFRPERAAQMVENPPPTTLTAFFTLCQEDEFARDLLYVDVPSYYTWNKTRKSWARRKRAEQGDDDDVKIKLPDGSVICETKTLGRIKTMR